MLNQNRVFVPKGWGWEDWIVNKEEYCGKLLFVKKGKRCSWHYHKLKDETFYVKSGCLMLSYVKPSNSEYYIHENRDWTLKYNIEQGGFETVCLVDGDSFHIPPYTVHQFSAVLDTYLFEFSTQHFDEDSYRVIKGD